MPRRVMVGLVLLSTLFASQRAFTADVPESGIEPLQFLIGEWKGTDADGKVFRTVYQLTSGGTSLTETLTPSDSPAMTTMYHTDGESVMLTHYCSMNNQPRMKAGTFKPGDKTLVFSFVDATNLKGPTDAHMHQVTFDFKDRDHFSQTWVLSKAGKEMPKTFMFERVK